MTGSTPRVTVGAGVATDMLDIEDVDDTEIETMAAGVGTSDDIQLKLDPPILSADVTIWRAVVITEMKRSCIDAIVSFLLGRAATSILVRSSNRRVKSLSTGGSFL